MPKLYQFPAIKCSANENFRSSSLAGCRYEAKVPDFTPHNKDKGVKGTIKPSSVNPDEEREGNNRSNTAPSNPPPAFGHMPRYQLHNFNHNRHFY